MRPDRAADAARLRRELAARPDDAVSWHNLAAAEGDLGNAREAETAARRAIALGIEAPETRLVLARALIDVGSLDEAEARLEEAVALRPAYAEAHRDLAQLRWMRTGDPAAALARLDRALAGSSEPHLYLVRSIALEFMGAPQDALAEAFAGLGRAPTDLQLLRQAAHLSADAGDGVQAVALAQRAAGLAPGDPGVQLAVCEALLAAGEPGPAEKVAAALCAADPADQHAIALRATAWRLLGDPRYRSISDYPRLVACERIDPPVPGESLEAFLESLGEELEGLHRFRLHPYQQSVRGGGQLPLDAAKLARPRVKALFESIRAVARRHLARLERRDDPFSARNTGDYVVTGAWSVRLASGGFHADHVHPRGWLSAVCYIAIPPTLDTAGGTVAERAGWLRLGHAGIRTQPQLPADAYIKPQAGTVALFPAYLWHGVEPFESATPRVSIAFDALPA